MSSRPQKAMNGSIVVRLAGCAVIAVTLIADVASQPSASPEVLQIRSGDLTLRAEVWRPPGKGRFPAVLFNHGSYTKDDALPPANPPKLASVFVRHGYLFLWLYRQGVGLSRGQGIPEGEQMVRTLKSEGLDSRNRLQLRLLENDSLAAASTALARLRARADVDPRRIGVVGHSFGGSLSLLMAERDPEIRAVVVFGGAAGSWNQSPMLRDRLGAAVGRMSAPVLFIHAENDYSTAPGSVLSAEMRRLGKAQSLKIYPPFGPDQRTGHNLIFGSVSTWESDTFAFLDQYLKR
jgi:carboxymethylenebutenolidase